MRKFFVVLLVLSLLLSLCAFSASAAGSYPYSAWVYPLYDRYTYDISVPGLPSVVNAVPYFTSSRSFFFSPEAEGPTFYGGFLLFSGGSYSVISPGGPYSGILYRYSSPDIIVPATNVLISSSTPLADGNPAYGSYQPSSSGSQPVSASFNTTFTASDHKVYSVSPDGSINDGQRFDIDEPLVGQGQHDGYIKSGTAVNLISRLSFQLEPGVYKLSVPTLVTPDLYILPYAGFNLPSSDGAIQQIMTSTNSGWTTNDNISFDSSTGLFTVSGSGLQTLTYNWVWNYRASFPAYINTAADEIVSALPTLNVLPTVGSYPSVSSSIEVTPYEWVENDPIPPSGTIPAPTDPSPSLPPSSDTDIQVNTDAILEMLRLIYRLQFSSGVNFDIPLYYPGIGKVNLSNTYTSLPVQLSLQYATEYLWHNETVASITSVEERCAGIYSTLREILASLPSGSVGSSGSWGQFEDDYIQAYSPQISNIESKISESHVESELNSIYSGLSSGDWSQSVLSGVVGSVGGGSLAWGLWSQDTVDAFNGDVDDWYSDFESRRSSW